MAAGRRQGGRRRRHRAALCLHQPPGRPHLQERDVLHVVRPSCHRAGDAPCPQPPVHLADQQLWQPGEVVEWVAAALQPGGGAAGGDRAERVHGGGAVGGAEGEQQVQFAVDGDYELFVKDAGERLMYVLLRFLSYELYIRCALIHDELLMRSLSIPPSHQYYLID